MIQRNLAHMSDGMSLLVSSHRPTEAMTTHRSPIHPLITELALRSRGRSGQQIMLGLRLLEIDCLDASAPLDLVEALHAREEASADDRQTAHQIVDDLIGLATCEEDAGLIALVALEPALKRLISRASCSSPLAAEIVDDLSTIAWESLRLAGAAPRGCRVSALLYAAATRIRTSARRRQLELERSEELNEFVDVVDASLDPANGLLGSERSILAGAVNDGVITILDAELIEHTRIDGACLLELAGGDRSVYLRLHRQRLQAEAALRRHLAVADEADR